MPRVILCCLYFVWHVTMGIAAASADDEAILFCKAALQHFKTIRGSSCLVVPDGPTISLALPRKDGWVVNQEGRFLQNLQEGWCRQEVTSYFLENNKLVSIDADHAFDGEATYGISASNKSAIVAYDSLGKRMPPVVTPMSGLGDRVLASEQGEIFSLVDFLEGGQVSLLSQSEYQIIPSNSSLKNVKLMVRLAPEFGEMPVRIDIQHQIPPEKVWRTTRRIKNLEFLHIDDAFVPTVVEFSSVGPGNGTTNETELVVSRLVCVPESLVINEPLSIEEFRPQIPPTYDFADLRNNTYRKAHSGVTENTATGEHSNSARSTTFVIANIVVLAAFLCWALRKRRQVHLLVIVCVVETLAGCGGELQDTAHARRSIHTQDPNMQRLLVSPSQRQIIHLPASSRLTDQRVFELTNTTENSMQFGPLKTSCGCVDASLNRQDLPPGETVVLNVTTVRDHFVHPKTVQVVVPVKCDSPFELPLVIEYLPDSEWCPVESALAITVKAGARVEIPVSIRTSKSANTVSADFLALSGHHQENLTLRAEGAVPDAWELFISAIITSPASWEEKTMYVDAEVPTFTGNLLLDDGVRFVGLSESSDFQISDVSLEDQNGGATLAKVLIKRTRKPDARVSQIEALVATNLGSWRVPIFIINKPAL